MQIDKLALTLAQFHGDVPLDIHKRVRVALDGLPERQRAIVNRRFALEGGKRLTLEEVALEQGNLTTERVRQLEHAALKSLSGAVFA